MMMNLPRTNIEKQLLKSRNKRKKEDHFLQEIHSIFKENDKIETAILHKIENGGNAEDINFFNFDLLETNRIFHISDIEKICVNYRLRFLSSKYFKAKIPYDAIMAIRKLENDHKTSLKGFRIIAPAHLFKLDNADDPLLMAPMGNEYYYLVHKWGNDLHPFRKLLMWPFKKLENFIFSMLVLSLAITFLIPDKLFFHAGEQSLSEFLMILFFVFKWVGGLAIFYGFKKGKNFSETIWESKYYNA
ncbi:hypothetical protein [Zunongwangia sp. HGR-M22]|uniref:hypothetical protein n=1 Tax=Zunongwangia sp. HGR-M22 TaxID=3015168 RepID=UPI0022DE4011|nr:hypothetical protein [Zunongwangia sp. HGR-M22]WBL24788.1 hypothetical protein PBT91_12825 [Zunongwangia sp. HGR-M22]